MSRFIKVLIIINGLIIPTGAAFVLYKVIADSFRSRDHSADIIVGKELEQAKNDSIAIQGISYERPLEIYNSSNLYLPVSVRNYEEAKSLRNGDSFKFGESRSKLKVGNSDNFLNVLFLDGDFHVIRQLVDKKASITEIFINPGGYNRENIIDSTVKNIAFQIGFEDTNKDDKLNSLDDHDLYISDLDGSNLRRVTSQKEIMDFDFIKSNTEIFVRYKDRSEMKEEYKHVKFGRYNILTGVFSELKEIEAKLIGIEAKLVR
jgi:hypothetical protein